MRATKLVCTLGPASASLVRDLVRAGMDVGRINCSHGTRADHDALARAVREASAAEGRAVGIMADLSGPKVRLGDLGDGPVHLPEGGTMVLSPGTERADVDGGRVTASTSYPDLASDLRPGDRVLLSDGAVELQVVASRGADLVTEVLRGGTVRSRAGVNVPSERLALPAISEKDRRDAEWALGVGAEMLAQSFVRRAEDVDQLRRLVGDAPPLLVAKIETVTAVEESDRILELADAIMVARGDLGVETSLERIPVIQKRLVAAANRLAKPVIIATQMLESMVRAPRPTRAETSDTAGAVFEGADAILLSAETAIGDHPVAAAGTAALVLEVAESEGREFLPPAREVEDLGLEELPLARAAAVLAAEGGATAIACYTRTGLTGRLLSAARPRVPIFAFSADPGAVGRLTLFHGVVPVLARPPDSTDALIAMMDERLRAEGHVSEGEDVIMVASSPVARTHANLLKVHHVGSAEP